ncbi:5-formyltetrahydrofolate cyclo-ligase [Rhizobiaceae bacterium BDR2-2]|uniref:5-formyltetrahydrofolate cyclo-ligase n=1 Tax=Ectorhizobium quercum TaxID=2965071 RepID=A0AAE3MYG1_9HYPH|nr:5-formyltetrahydrofolate cyclo-ligase [Ectorhizobium quercum]MCX8996786.1 5-formyltetrahydrofolate cyclo-ligase [Ectorhizobium quercum]
MSETISKAVLRAERLAARDGLSPRERACRSAAICRHGIAGLDVPPGAVVSGYYPIRSEADIMPLLAALAQKGARLCLPAVLDRETIAFRLYDPARPLTDTGWGTMGAPADAPLADPDIILMPLSAFDRYGNRIGYGAGHYDRAIDRMRERDLRPRLVGVAFACQESEAVPADAHDVPMDAVLTEEGFRTLPSPN